MNWGGVAPCTDFAMWNKLRVVFKGISGSVPIRRMSQLPLEALLSSLSWSSFCGARRRRSSSSVCVCVFYSELKRTRREGKEVGLGRRKASVVKTTALWFFFVVFFFPRELPLVYFVCVWTLLTGYSFSLLDGLFVSYKRWLCDFFRTAVCSSTVYKTCCCWPCVLLLSTSEIIWRKEQDAARWRAASSPARQPREMASHWFQWTFLLHGMLIEHHPTVSPGKNDSWQTNSRMPDHNFRFTQCLTHELSCVLATTYYYYHNILLHPALEWNVSHEKKQEILQTFPSQKTRGNDICLSFSLSCPFWNTICEKWDFHESCDVSTVSSSMWKLLDKLNRGGELHQLTWVQKRKK